MPEKPEEILYIATHIFLKHRKLKYCSFAISRFKQEAFNFFELLGQIFKTEIFKL